jgi:hypothetical protein
MVVGNPNTSGDDPALDATALYDFGTVTVGVAAGGSVGMIGVEDATVGYNLGATLNIGDPGSGEGGSGDVSKSMTVSASLNVGGNCDL